MTETADQLKALLAEFVAPLLKAAGFKRTRNRWVRDCGHAFECIGVQVSMHDATSFTVNLGVVHPAVDELLGWPPTKPTEITFVSTRLGQLETAYDQWWSVADPDVAADVADLLRRLGIPWLDERLDPLACAKVERVAGDVEAAFSIVGGDTAAALRIYEAAVRRLERATDPDDTELWKLHVGAILDVLRRAGLVPK